MQTISTMLRAVVMLLALAIGWKAWQLYGPSSEQLRSIVSRAAEIAQEAAKGESETRALTADPRMSPPVLAAEAPDTSVPEPFSGAIPVAAELLPARNVVEPASFVVDENAIAMNDDVTRLPEVGEALEKSAIQESAPIDDDKLQTKIAQLESIGMRDAQLEPWGSNGELYRFSCRMPWGETAAFMRHFESVAPEPTAAVEAVAEKIDAWRLAENRGTLRR